MKAIVWSKNNCPHCVEAKSMLAMRGIEVEERNVEKGWTKEQLLESVPNARTVPQIFIDGEYIGGVDKLKEHFKNNIVKTGVEMQWDNISYPH